MPSPNDPVELTYASAEKLAHHLAQPLDALDSARRRPLPPGIDYQIAKAITGASAVSSTNIPTGMASLSFGVWRFSSTDGIETDRSQDDEDFIIDTAYGWLGEEVTAGDPIYVYRGKHSEGSRWYYKAGIKDTTATTVPVRVGVVGSAQITKWGSGSVKLYSGGIGAEADTSTAVTASDWAGFGPLYPDQQVLLEKDDTDVWRVWAGTLYSLRLVTPYSLITSPSTTTTSGLGTGVEWTNNGVTDGSTGSGHVSDRSMVFDGTADHLEINSTNTTINPAQSWTFSAWVKIDSTLADNPLWVIGPDAGTASAKVQINTSGDVQVTTDGGADVSYTGGSLSTGQYYHIVVVYDFINSRIIIWVDGIPEVFDISGLLPTQQSNDVQKVGTNLAEDAHLDGDLDQMLVLDGCWDQGAVDEVYNDGTGITVP